MSLKFMTVIAVAFCALVIGCGTESGPITSKSTNYEVGDDSTGATTSNAAAPEATVTAALSDATSVVNGQVPPRRPEPMKQTPAAGSNSSDIVQPTPEQLLTVIRQLRQQQPKGVNNEEVIADFVNIQSKLIPAIDMLLALKPADDTVTEVAAAKIEALTAVSQLGAKDAMEQVFAFIEELEQHPSEKVSAFGRQQSFVTLLNAFSTDQVTDAQQVIDAYKKLAGEQPKEGGLLAFGRDVASRLMEKGLNNEAAELLRYTAGLVQPTQDARLNAAADAILEQAKFAELDLGTKLSAVAEGKEGAIEEFTKMLGELTAGEKVGLTTLQTIMQIASMLEPEHGDAATKVYDVLEASSAKSSDEEFAAIIKETIDKYRLRSAIVGKPFILEGNLLDGTPFDWNQYQGKVVLVDFWATWCGPCLREMPNIRANFETYRDQGFEVVGVNLDEDVQELKDFSSLQPLPWPSVLSADPTAVGWEHPMAVRNGVAAIPFLVLVDREGIAIALNTRGPALGEKLAELFPDAASESEKPAATKPADDKPAEAEPASESAAANPAEGTASDPAPPE
ncbi:MAG: TlpA disulfide reductase family protein [Planctomycetota bacterium]|nr:TlpA disulfide reductase family protein [Planctomycetota bacterium]